MNYNDIYSKSSSNLEGSGSTQNVLHLISFPHLLGAYGHVGDLHVQPQSSRPGRTDHRWRSKFRDLSSKVSAESSRVGPRTTSFRQLCFHPELEPQTVSLVILPATDVQLSKLFGLWHIAGCIAVLITESCILFVPWTDFGTMSSFSPSDFTFDS